MKCERKYSNVAKERSDEVVEHSREDKRKVEQGRTVVLVLLVVTVNIYIIYI